MTLENPSVISISSHVSRGSVGNRAATFAFEALGIHTWTVNTIQLPWHPGHGKSTKIIPDPEQFATFLADIANAPWIDEVGAVFSGYMATTDQVEATAGLIKTLRRAKPELTYVCDPVIGDKGGLYVSPDIAIAIRDKLVPLADITTPNRFELEWLGGKFHLQSANEVILAARLLSPATVLVTSAPALMRGSIANLRVKKDIAEMAEHREIEGAPNGPGDLTAAIYLAHLLQGRSESAALKNTTASVFEIITRAKHRDSDELMLETDYNSIVRPKMPVSVRSITV